MDDVWMLHLPWEKFAIKIFLSIVWLDEHKIFLPLHICVCVFV